MRYYEYVLQSKIDDKFYVGYTKKWDQRLVSHNNGNVF